MCRPPMFLGAVFTGRCGYRPLRVKDTCITVGALAHMRPFHTGQAPCVIFQIFGFFLNASYHCGRSFQHSSQRSCRRFAASIILCSRPGVRKSDAILFHVPPGSKPSASGFDPEKEEQHLRSIWRRFAASNDPWCCSDAAALGGFAAVAGSGPRLGPSTPKPGQPTMGCPGFGADGRT